MYPTEPLPLRRQKDRFDRERLAEAALKKKCAKHKGRNHWRNWERRKMAREKAEAKAPVIAKAVAAARRYHAEVRSYWRGLRADHP